MTENIGVYACADIPYPQVFFTEYLKQLFLSNIQQSLPSCLRTSVLYATCYVPSQSK